MTIANNTSTTKRGKSTVSSETTATGKSIIHECPNCFNDMYIPYFPLVCEKCGFDAKIPYYILYDKFEADLSARLGIKNEIFKQLKEKYEQSKKAIPSPNDDNSYSPVFRGEVLEFIKSTASEFEFGSNDKAISFIVTAFYVLKKFISNMHGKNVYLIDEHGNRSDNFMKAVFKSYNHVVYDSQNKQKVSNLLNRISNEFAIEEQKNKLIDSHIKPTTKPKKRKRNPGDAKGPV